MVDKSDRVGATTKQTDHASSINSAADEKSSSYVFIDLSNNVRDFMR